MYVLLGSEAEPATTPLVEQARVRKLEPEPKRPWRLCSTKHPTECRFRLAAPASWTLKFSFEMQRPSGSTPPTGRLSFESDMKIEIEREGDGR